jgi:hypothetical protein
MKSLWVIPVCFNPTNPVVYECIDAIQKYHDHPDIIVVDSAGSTNHDYFDFCIDRGVKIASINNQLYATGAHAWSFVHHPDYDFFNLIFDSVIVQSNLDHLQEQPLTTLRHWPSSMHDWGWDETNGDHLSIWGAQQLDRMGIPFTTEYIGIMGPVMFAQRAVLKSLYDCGYFFTQVTNAHLQCAMERIAGIALVHLGWDVSNSLQGVHSSHGAIYDESMIRKVDLARA